MVIKWILSLFLSFTFLKHSAQNLIPNPGFENFTSCPLNFTTPAYNEFAKAYPWNHPTFGTSDFFHVCNNAINGNAGVPFNILGNQIPHAGSGYAGIFAYPLYREFMQSPLNSPMIIGKKYCVSFYVSCSEGMQSQNINNYANDALGALFTTVPVSRLDDLLTLIPQIQNPAGKILKDTLNWELICGSFVADSAYTFITIGYIGPYIGRSEELIKKYSDKAPYSTYYYIDDITVSLPPTVDAGANLTIPQGSSVTLSASGGSSYIWSPAEGLSCTDCPNPVVSPSTTTTYI